MRLARAGSSFGSRLAGTGMSTLFLLWGFLSGCVPAADDCDAQNGCGQCDPRSNADPVDDRCGFFVSRAGGSDANDGTKGRPLQSLSEAVRRAGERGAHVFACAETFEETVAVPAGVKIFGGLSCEQGFTFVSDEHKTIIAPAQASASGAMVQGAMASAIAMTLGGPPKSAPGGTALTTRLQNLVVQAPDGAWPLGSSIAVMVLGNTEAEIRGCTLIAGRGDRGTDGGQVSEAPAASGIAGASGVAACTSVLGKGGPSPSLICGSGEASVGGVGGNGAQWNAFSGALGLPDWGAGLGGAGQNANSFCQDGSNGADGENGSDGAGARGMGGLSDKGFVGIFGNLGQQGKPGQGGGGGGGSLSNGLCFVQYEHGAGGGSGGTGGCGGMGGLGGGYGGASIGLISISAKVHLEDVQIRTKGGGDGGHGGPPQEGGDGGAGGDGGTSKVVDVAFGCKGGGGGRGGRGGHGGGGLGGPSVGVAFVGSKPKMENTEIDIGSAGVGGRGALGFTLGKVAGQDGVWGTVAEFPSMD